MISLTKLSCMPLTSRMTNNTHLICLCEVRVWASIRLLPQPSLGSGPIDQSVSLQRWQLSYKQRRCWQGKSSKTTSIAAMVILVISGGCPSIDARHLCVHLLWGGWAKTTYLTKGPKHTKKTKLNTLFTNKSLENLWRRERHSITCL